MTDLASLSSKTFSPLSRTALKTLARLALIAVTAFTSAGAANASTSIGRYTFNNLDNSTGNFDTIDFSFSGTLGSDGNTIVSISNFGAFLNGSLLLDPATTTGCADRFDDSNSVPTVTLNGIGDAFEFVSGDGQSFFHIQDVNTIEFGNGDDTQSNSDILLTPLTVAESASVAPVPEPASTALLLAGLGVVGVATGRRKASAQADRSAEGRLA